MRMRLMHESKYTETKRIHDGNSETQQKITEIKNHFIKFMKHI